VPIDGIPMALHMATILSQGGCVDVFLVGPQGPLQSLGLKIISQTNQGHHPLFGVAAALEQSSLAHMLFAPCDLINLEPIHIQALLSTGGPCVAVCEGQVHPLLTVLPTAWAPKALALAMSNSPAMRLISDLPQIELPAPSLMDANTPDDMPR